MLFIFALFALTYGQNLCGATAEDCSWSINTDGTVLTITGTGKIQLGPVPEDTFT